MASATDYSFLDGMSISELEELQDEISERLESASDDEVEDGFDDSNLWVIEYAVDEYGRELKDQPYAETYGFGEFSDSTTTDSFCVYTIRVVPFSHDELDAGIVTISIDEYGTDRVQAVYETITYSIDIRDKNGGTHTTYGLMIGGTDMIAIFYSESDNVNLYELLLDGGPVNISMESTGDYAGSSYQLTIEDSSGLADVMASIANGEA